ncbi:MAG TPA: SgcJ/EcaC family oxidoreductase [Chitinophagaceae bacterium]|nr:SgcJ/EcaC family oxidoreductase [Chitinophagaceae bacterium]
MKLSLNLLPLLLPVIIATACRTQKITGSVNDEQAIREVLAKFEKAFEDRDAKIYAANFTRDAEWENAFGSREKGRENIENRLAGVYQMFQQANQKIKEIRIRFITPDVAVADVDREIVGQVNVSGEKVLPQRNVRTTHIFKKENGKWLVMVFRIADLRNPQEVR